MTTQELIDLVEDIPSYILDDDIEIYNEFISKVPDGGLIADLGTGWGKSAVLMAAANPKAVVFTIDDGNYPIAQKWAPDKPGYFNKLKEEFIKHNVNNIILVDGNVLTYEPKYTFNVLHLDMMQEAEVPCLIRWWPHLVEGGIALVRNYARFNEEGRTFLKDKKVVAYKGLILVVQK